MKVSSLFIAVSAFLFVVPLSSCGSAEDDSQSRISQEIGAEAAGQVGETRSVRIVSPVEGAVIEGPNVRVELAVEGFAILPAGDTTPNSGHHHLFLDEDLTEAGRPVPTVPGRIIHMGDASAGYVFEGVEPGEHRVIAVVGDLAHIPLQPWVVDTVHFVVR